MKELDTFEEIKEEPTGLEVLTRIADSLSEISKTLNEIKDDMEGSRNGLEISINGPVSVQNEEGETLACHCIQDN